MRLALESQEILKPASDRFALVHAPLEVRAAIVARRFLVTPAHTLILVSSHERALNWRAKLMLIGVPEDSIFELPSGNSGLFEDAAPEAVAVSDRMKALRAITGEQPYIVLATPEASLERTLPADELREHIIQVEEGKDLDIDHLASALQSFGYEPAEPVRIPGQFSRRGGIFDVFATGFDMPIRLDLMGDTVESIRFFDPNTQRSSERAGAIEFGPSRETLFPKESDLSGLVGIISSTLEQEANQLSPVDGDKLRELVSGDLRGLQDRVFFDRLDLYRPYLHSDSGCVIDLLPESGQIVLDEPDQLLIHAQRTMEDLGDALKSRAGRGEILQSTAGDFMLDPEHIANPSRLCAMVLHDEVPKWLGQVRKGESEFRSLGNYQGQSAALLNAIQTWLGSGFHLAIASDQPNRARSMLEQVGLIPGSIPSDVKELEPGLFLVDGNLAGGFLCENQKIALITDQELFGVGRLKLPQRKFNEGTPISTVLDLKDGDYVVHINFGIGRFRGLITRIVDGVEKEYLHIEYSPPDKLFVPADQLDRIQRYLNPSDYEPKLNRLTGGEWQKTVKKAREEAREFARDLTRLYAQRKAVQRTPFGPDSPWQTEMEATFPFVETPSQMRAIVEAKNDLELDYPMDRLVCGDVGFGKTEVAIRAAFKAAQDNRQVVMLCPTTILSEQHFRNFCERLAPFPVRLELLNRFRTGAERRAIEDKLEAGDVDIVIGTHALLGKSLKFKNLGLLIIDEEHKFGVKQKEALKSLRVNVDVLTMTATPIPRTLSMALMDIRQMSLISDPPPGRLPVRTFVRSYGKEVVREAILRELARGGQVYYVSNRVQGLEHVAERLRQLVPHAKIVVGHGQMHEHELESVMVAFIKGEADILLSTTIVESGLDIPNANTLIIENADRFGLAQLYQLRGRVGRSDRQAYAYFLHDGMKSMTENAQGRLDAIQEFSSLGSGYNLAFRDLQIRGAGELLGAKQHGTMATVGYELYTQLIAEEVSFLKAHADGDGVQREYRDPLEGLELLPPLDLPTNARIPETYIEDQGQRLYYYRVLMSARSKEAITECENEMADRYGKPPDEVRRAAWIMRLRLRAHQLKIEKVDGSSGRLAVDFFESAQLPPRLWPMLQKAHRDAYQTRGRLFWPYQGGPVGACDQMITALETCLQQIEESRLTART